MLPEEPTRLLDATRDAYRRYVNPGLERLMSFAGFGLEWEAEGCYVTDAEGNRYLDCLGGYGVFSLGHRHPKVVEAVKKQLDRMPLSSKVFFNKPLADLAERLAAVAPGDLQYSFLCNSGTEAVEAAIKIARKATHKSKFVCTIGGFHGKSMGSLSASGREVFRAPFDPLVPGFVHVPFGDIDSMREAVDDETAGVIIEPIQGEGGIVIPPDGYLSKVAELCRERNTLLIVDEVQTGLGRTGRMFAVESEGVEPDLMTLAKSLGGGVIPSGATLGTPAVWEPAFAENPLIHSSTFGGNPLAAVAGLTTLQVIEEEGLCERSARMGERMLRGLRGVQSDFPTHIAEVRGRGLMIGIVFSEDDVGELCVGQLTARGVICAYTLNNPRVIRMEPPLIISEEQCDFAVSAFADAMAATSSLLQELGA
ncbi:MAG: aminotransferase [Fimbriimonadales bacterium]